MSKRRIFISYSRRDKEFVFQVRDLVERFVGPKSCWVDLTGIESDEQFIDTITDAIDNCDIFLFFYSVYSEKSKWTRKEIRYAENQGKRIVFVKIDDTALSKFFKFEYGDLDINDIRDKDQKHKLLLNLCSWCGIDFPEGMSEDLGDGEISGKDAPTPFYKNKKTWFKIIVGVLCVVACIIVIDKLISWGKDSYVSYMKDRTEENVSVDLALPSGTLWASQNVFAKNSDDGGKYFSWGEVKPKDGYHLGRYKQGSLKDSLIAGTKYDAARKVLGGNWEIPTDSQFLELRKYCKWRWKHDRYFCGFIVTGKNGNSIKLPAAGRNCASKPEWRNYYGYYWTANSSKTDSTCAACYFIGRGLARLESGYRYYGRCIRPVKTK